MAVSIGDIDLDGVTLPETELTDDLNEEEDDNYTQIEETKPQKISEKWDWNADFIPLQWDGTITVSTFPSSSATNSQSDQSPQPIHIQTQPKSPLKNTTQSYRDESKRKSNSIPPWISNTYHNHHFIDRLHMELVDFCMYVSPTKQEHSTRLSLIHKITQIVCSIWQHATLHVFGSMKTKLYLPTSDIDLVVYPNINDINNITSTGDYKLHLAQALKRANMCSYLEIISTARVPLIKFTDASSNISVDIIFDRESGIVAADEINALQAQYPVLRPLTYFLKYFLWFRDLNEPFRGGMGSYLLQMLIVNLIQTHPVRATRKWRYVDSEISLGGWLMAFFELYGKHFNYSELGIVPYPNAHYFIKEEHGMKVYDRPYLLCCECPFESTPNKIMDSGRNTYNIMKIKLAFEWAYNTLLANVKNHRKSILGLLVGVRGGMLQIRSKDNKLLKFESSVVRAHEMENLLSKTFEVESMSSCTENDENESENELFIPLNDDDDDITSSSSYISSSTMTSSSSYESYNGDIDVDIDNGKLAYYEASEFQQKHLFNTHTSPTLSALKMKENVRFNFECDYIEHNPYLNEKYVPFKNKSRKKRKFSMMSLNDDGGVELDVRTPQLKKRKTTSVLMDKVEGGGGGDSDSEKNNNKLCRSYSMSDLRKSTPCIFYQKGGCKKGKTCPFQHGDDGRKGIKDKDFLVDSSLQGGGLLNQVCWNFASGHCHRGNKCRWLHSITPNSQT